MVGLSRFGSIAAALRQTNFRWYMTGASISLIGVWAQRIAMGWLTWELTRSGTWLGLISFADLFPTVVVTPIAGVIADRVDRRLMSMVSHLLALLQATALAALTWTGLITVWLLLALALFLGVVMAFATAARLAMVPTLLDRRYLPSALAIDSGVFNMARFIGPAIAGWIIVRWGVAAAFLFNGLTLLAYVAALTKVRMIHAESRGGAERGILSQMLDGLGYVSRHAGIGPILILLISVAVGVKAVLELMPGVADAVFRRGAEGLGLLVAAAGIGAFLGALWLAQRAAARGLTGVVVAAQALGGAAVLVFAATGVFAVGLAGAFFIGMASTLCGTGTQTLMQGVVEGAVRGRVMSLYGVVNRGAPALGALVMGAASEIVGFQWAVAGGGALALLVFLWVLGRRADMRAALEKESV